MSLGLAIISNAASAAPQPSPTNADESAASAVGVDELEAFVFDHGGGHRLPYRLYRPQVRDGEKVPLVLFLHGAGGRGTDNRKQLTDQSAPLVFVQPENQRRWPSFFLAPQCPTDRRWVEMAWDAPSGKGQRPPEPSWPMAAALALVDKLAAEIPAIDTTRLFVTGISMGGFGAFDAAVRRPDMWKAAVPICGGYDETAVAPIVRLPLWAFHAEDDPTVPVARTRAVVAALRSLGGRPRYTEYPARAGHGHFSWIPAYADPDLLPWMFGAPRMRPPSPGGPRMAGAPSIAEETPEPQTHRSRSSLPPQPLKTATAPPPPSAPGRQQRQRGCGCVAMPVTAALDADAAVFAVAALTVVLRLRKRRRRWARRFAIPV